MSRLNAGAFEFVPGRAFQVPQSSAPSQPPLQPIERPEKTEAPPPPPTLSLNIGGSKPPPKTDPIPAPQAQNTPAQPTPSEAPKVSAPTSAPKAAAAGPTAASKTFTTERSKNDATAIASDVQSAADHETLQDLYGDSQYLGITPYY